jgi:hypothetical protein
MPAKTPRPIGSTDSFFPVSTAAFDESATAVDPLAAPLVAVVVLDALEVISAAAGAVLDASKVLFALVEVVVVPGEEPVKVGDETDVEVFGVTVETGYGSVSTVTA